MAVPACDALDALCARRFQDISREQAIQDDANRSMETRSPPAESRVTIAQTYDAAELITALQYHGSFHLTSRVYPWKKPCVRSACRSFVTICAVAKRSDTVATWKPRRPIMSAKARHPKLFTHLQIPVGQWHAGSLEKEFHDRAC